MFDVTAFERPRWLRDVRRFLPLKPQFVLSGNVRDLQPLDVGTGQVTSQPLSVVLAAELRDAGYAHVLLYDPVAGFRELPPTGGAAISRGEILVQLGLQPDQGGVAPAGLDLMSETLARLASRPGEPIATIVDFASRLVVRHDALAPPEHQAFTRALVSSHASRPKPCGSPPRPFFNTVFWVAEKEGDLPDWLLVGNPRIRHVPIARPEHRTRRVVARSLIKGMPEAAKAAPHAIEQALDAFVEGTEGMLLLDMVAVAQLARSEGIALSDVGDAVRRYKVGVSDDPWAAIDRGKVRRGADIIRGRVKGQDQAVTHVLDIVKRAVTGVGAPRRGSRPRGVAFFAGPTGVGKTELAKALTSLLFGNEDAYIRFDMSEFSSEHSDQRLIGAPPGYVGYDVGGELTNAIREKPFSVVLFDEIEKAHPRILDKFLQILDDGVLTSGRGDRTYFSEAFIVFTSNLGIYRSEPNGGRVANVTPDDAFEVVQDRVRSEIGRHFKEVLNRPEILNRIGDNVLVFDFIRPAVAAAVLESQVDGVLADVAAGQGIEVVLDATVRERLRELCLADLSNGGRGIRNKVEAHLLNPLARALFDADAGTGQRLLVDGLDEAGGVTVLSVCAMTAAAAA